jgi:hypothetical protein
VLDGAVRSRGSLVSTARAGPALLSKFLAGTANHRSGRTIASVNQVHRDDIASAIFFLVTRERQRTQIYNVVDDQPMLQMNAIAGWHKD